MLRPAALLEELPDEVASEVEPLFPTCRRVGAREVVHEDDWDVLVTGAKAIDRASHMYVVAFGANRLDIPYDESGSAGTSELLRGTVLALNRSTLAMELSVPTDVREALGALVHTDLVPVFAGMTERPTLGLYSPWSALGRGGTHSVGAEVPAPILALVRPLLLAGGDSTLAGRFTRSAGWEKRAGPECSGGELWFLPAEVEEHAAWVLEALRHWQTLDPTRFPAPPDWWRTGDWATPEQVSAREALAHLAAERATVVQALERRQVELTAASRAADDGAKLGPLRLLTEDGDDLELAVLEALTSFGFAARKMDEVHPGNDRREDLRVTDTDEPSWECLVEIKGYGRGAAVNDLARLSRWSARYAVEKGRLPGAMWHVVNHFRDTDPNGRPIAIPNDDDLADFAADGGTLIDTRQIFRAWRDVTTGAIRAESVRSSLKAARGRWSY